MGVKCDPAYGRVKSILTDRFEHFTPEAYGRG